MNRKRRRPFAQTFMLDVFMDSKARPFMIYIIINLLIGAVIFHWLEGWNWLDSFYFVVITLTTIGYGDFSPTTPITKIFAIFYSINGVIMLLFLFDLVRSVRGWDSLLTGTKQEDSAENDTTDQSSYKGDFQMSDVPVQVIVAAFQDEKAAKGALTALKQARREGLIKIENAAVLRKDAKGKLHIKETHDMGGGKGAAFGGVGGAAIGLIAGTALAAPVVVGALVGGLVAKLRDSGFSNKRLENMGQGLKPGTSAIIAVVEHTWVAKVEEALAEAQAEVITAEIQADIASQLEAGHEVAYSVIASQEGVEASRVAGGEDMVEGGKLVVDESGVYGGRFVATEEGFAVKGFAETEDGAVEALIVGVNEDEETEEDDKE
jgi:uncharacterized membrane protein